MSKIFSSIFLQPPTFLEMPYVGLEISDSAVRFVEFVDKAGVLTLGHFATVPLTEGIVSDGEIKEEKKLASILTELKKKYSLEFVKVSLPENKSYLFKMQLPGQLSKPAEIRQAIEFRLEENIPIQTKDAIFDFEIIDTSPDGTIQNISVSASPAQLVENYTRCLTSAGLTPISFEVESKSVARAVVAKNDARPYIVLNIKDKTTTISIVERGQVEFSSSANIGGSFVDETIRREKKVSLEEAQKIKELYMYKDTKDSLEVFASLLNFIGAIKDETDRFYSYWFNRRPKNNQVDIEKILLCGRNSMISGFERYLYLAMNKDTDPADVWINAFSTEEYLPPINFVDSLDYAVAIGLALPVIQK